MKLLSIRSLLLATAVTATTVGGAFAEGQWTAASTTFPGSVRAGSRDVPVKPGDETVVAMQRLPAGISVSVLRGTELLTPEPLSADADGKISVPLKVPADAAVGIQPLTIITHNPETVSVTPLKISSILPPQGADGFTLKTTEVGERAYQSAVSADGKLFVASARGPKDGSRLIRLDAKTMEVEAEAEVAKSTSGEQIGVFGVGVDNANGHVWTTNTLSKTVTVYDAKTLKVVKVFPEGSVQHPRDVVIDEANSRAYVSSALTGFVQVYDTKTLEHVGQLQFVVENGQGAFATVDMTLDAKGGKLYSVSRETPWVGWIDLATGQSTTVEVPQAVGATDIARDPVSGRLYVVSQDSNNVVTLDAEGKLIADTYIGAGGVSVAWDAATSQVFAATRAGGTVAVLDADGKLVANLPMDETPNNLTAGPDGAVYLVAMYGKPGDTSQSGSVTRITPAK